MTPQPPDDLPIRLGSGRIRRLLVALDVTDAQADRWHPIGNYASPRTAATIAWRLRSGQVADDLRWDGEWRADPDGQGHTVYARRRPIDPS